MNGEHAQIKTVFLLGHNPDYEWFFNKRATTSIWYKFMEEEWTLHPWNGAVEEFGPGDSSFWDWKSIQENAGKAVFWFTDDYGETFAITLKREDAELIYGLQLINGNEKIVSSWE